MSNLVVGDAGRDFFLDLQQKQERFGVRSERLLRAIALVVAPFPTLIGGLTTIGDMKVHSRLADLCSLHRIVGALEIRMLLRSERTIVFAAVLDIIESFLRALLLY